MTNKDTIERLSTGNEFISISDISTSTAGISRVGFVYEGFRACIELHGTPKCPLLRPTVSIDGEETFDTEINSDLVSYWIPKFDVCRSSIRASALVFAPMDRRGFVCALRIENTSDRSVKLKAGWRGCWASTYYAANLPKPMAGVKHGSISSYRPGVPVVEYRGHTPLFAMAIVPQEVVPAEVSDSEGHVAAEWSAETLSATPGVPLYFALIDEYTLAAGEQRDVPVYVGFGLEEVSAIASAEELRLQGWERTLSSLKAWLDARTIECEDEFFKRLVNVNSFYSYFYSQAVALDTEEMTIVTARSSSNEFCGTYRDRDALLWSFPAVLQVSWSQARKMLIHALTTQLANVGVRSRYINGVVLEPGLQLDQLCAPIHALDKYVQVTGDMSVLFDRRVQHGINIIQQTLAAQRHPEVELFETLLLPSGEPSRFPYVCYSNVMVWRALRDAARLYDRIRDLDRAMEAGQLADRIRAAILANFVVDGPFGKMFARAIDLEGNFELGDDPAGSLQMLAYLEFCTADDPVYRKTVQWIYSEHNPFSNCAATFAQPSACGGPGPSVLSVVNELLIGRKEAALDFLERAKLDDGIACESVDQTTGRAISGKAHAAIAGYLAYGLRTALNLELPETAEVPQRRRPSEVLYQPPPPEAAQIPKKARL
ncbi:MAG: glycoside hydrolase family 125 protein [Armatimonadetes bacterium]|nr:glycoside hydrolase family 125 protein [Armatimonadota bacterium]